MKIDYFIKIHDFVHASMSWLLNQRKNCNSFIFQFVNTYFGLYGRIGFHQMNGYHSSCTHFEQMQLKCLIIQKRRSHVWVLYNLAATIIKYPKHFIASHANLRTEDRENEENPRKTKNTLKKRTLELFELNYRYHTFIAKTATIMKGSYNA